MPWWKMPGNSQMPKNAAHATPKATKLDVKAETLALEALRTNQTKLWADAKAVKKVADAYRKLGQ